MVLHKIEINVIADRCKNENCKHIFVDIRNTNRLTDNEKLIINDLKESIGYRAIARKIGRS